ncbi:hypothetical protein FEI13_05010 [Halomonas urmiana]|uniref:PLP-dependent transferase n=1 Tax=Halomonas urmiana TaxID=490901 RepID=A0A5R8MJP0_9GAMM|nr:PLP-dependent transferase [Halomonas urmiana]TLF52239.1 hypothetical protein FEI13_05010 [Halomonas urmiana]
MSKPLSSHLGPATLAIHSQQQKDLFGSPHMPIYDTTTFTFADTASLLEVTEGRRQGPLYSRYGQNPTLYALEETLAALENTEEAWAFSSGMAAISTLFLSHGRRGITDSMLRLSVGLEDVEDLLDDLHQALAPLITGRY